MPGRGVIVTSVELPLEVLDVSVEAILSVEDVEATVSPVDIEAVASVEATVSAVSTDDAPVSIVLVETVEDEKSVPADGWSLETAVLGLNANTCCVCADALAN